MSVDPKILQEIEQWEVGHEETKIIGTITDYIPLVIANPKLADLSHAKVHNMIVSHGIEWEDDEDSQDKIAHYKFFEDEVYGLNDPVNKIVDYFNSGSRLLPTRKRILMLMGPVGGGKSTLAAKIKKGLAQYSETEEGAVYAISGCPLHEDPLHLLPENLRKEMQNNHNIFIEGELCPVCNWKMKNEFKGDWRKFEIEKISFSEASRIGIGTFSPSDPKSQDIAELIGSINLAKLGEIGKESDPNAYEFDGEIEASNRGVLEMIEMLKCDVKFLHALLTVTQEQQIKTPRFPMVSVNVCVLAHTNQTEWNKFMNKPENEALQDRIITVPVPYVLKVSDEMRIYKKELRGSKDVRDVVIAPRTLDVCAMFAVLSRLESPKDQHIDLVSKMKAYNGEEVQEIRPAEIRKMRRESENEGMSGIGPREIMNAISQATTQARDALRGLNETQRKEMCFGVDPDCEQISVDAIDILQVLTKSINEDPKRDVKEKDRLNNILEMAKREYNEMAKEDIQEAFCYEFEEDAANLFKNYLSNVVAYCNGDRIKDPVTDDLIDPDDRLMSSVEEMIGVAQGNAKSFRENVSVRMAKAALSGKSFDFSMHSDLRDAIRKRIFEDRKDVINITTSTRYPDPKQLEEINRVIRRLVEKQSDVEEDNMIRYTVFSAARAIRYVGKLMNR